MSSRSINLLSNYYNMARYQGEHITGAVGSIVIYYLNGKAYVRSKPARMKQTAGTRTAAENFGRAAKLGKLIRANLSAALENPGDRSLVSGLNAAIIQWLNKDRKRISANNLLLKNFDCYPEHPLRGLIGFELVAVDDSTNIKISVPEYIPMRDIKLPSFIHSLNWRVIFLNICLREAPMILDREELEHKIADLGQLITPMEFKSHFQQRGDIRIACVSLEMIQQIGLVKRRYTALF